MILHLLSGYVRAFFFIEIIVTPHVLLCRDYTLKKIWKNLNRGGALLHVFAIFPTDYQQFTLRVPPSETFLSIGAL